MYALKAASHKNRAVAPALTGGGRSELQPREVACVLAARCSGDFVRRWTGGAGRDSGGGSGPAGSDLDDEIPF